MTGPVYAQAHIDPVRLTVLSATFRLYVGPSRDGTYLHVISPRQVDVADVDGVVVHRAGDLACTCRGGVYHGACYRLEEAQAVERGEADVDAWIRTAAPGELTEVFGR